MKDFVCFFFLSFLICYAVVAFGLSNIWVLIALAAAVLGVLLTALFNLNNKVDALKQQVEELAGKAAVPPAPPASFSMGEHKQNALYTGGHGFCRWERMMPVQVTQMKQVKVLIPRLTASP